jgi:small-conductance mechanosensitive channel
VLLTQLARNTEHESSKREETAMTAVPDDEFDGPEEQAEKAAGDAYLKVVIRKVAAMYGVLAAGLAISLADYAFAVAALWLLPRLLVAALASYITWEFWASGSGYLQARRAGRERRRQDAALSQDERLLASLSRARSVPLPPPWWRCGLRSSRFWRGLTVRLVYSAAAGLVLAHWLGLVPGAVAAVVFTAVALVLGARVGSVIAGGMNAAAFIDPRPPRDTPET